MNQNQKEQKLRIRMRLAFGLVTVVLWSTKATSAANDSSNLEAPVAPTYEDCSKYINEKIGERPACQARNTQAYNTYTTQVRAYNDVKASLESPTTASLIRPVEPNYANCERTNSDGTTYKDFTCESNNNTMLGQYQHELTIYEAARAQIEKTNVAQVTAQNVVATTNANTGIINNLADIAKEANEQAKSAKKSGNLLTASSLGFMAAFYISCSGAGATCNYYYLATSIAMGFLAKRDYKASSDAQNTAAKACATYAQLSSEASSSCASIPVSNSSNSGSNSPSLSDTYDSSGNCIAADTSLCSAVKKQVADQGSNIKDLVKGISKFAGGIKTNSDGSIAVAKTGKTYKESDFKDKASMVAAGFTPAQAQQAMDSINKGVALANQLSKAKDDLKAANGKEKASNFSLDFPVGAGAAGASDMLGADGKALGSGSGSITSKGIDGSSGSASGLRNPADVGLVRDFNGETIGSAGDDIFSMMNRRYKLKVSQSVFIGP